MATVIIAFIILALVIGGMAIGVMLGRKPITGSCGGIGAVGITGPCEICGGDPNKCVADDDDKQKIHSQLAVDATAKTQSEN